MKTTPFGERYGRFIVANRWTIIVLFGAILALAAYFLSSFKINASADTLLTKNNTLYIESQLAAKKFPADEFILVAYRPKKTDLYSQQTFDDLSLLAQQFSKLDRVKEVNSVLNVPLFKDKSALLGNTDISDLTYQKQNYSAQQMRSFLTGHPLFTDLLVNKQQTAFSIQITFNPNKELQSLNDKILTVTKNQLTRKLTDAEQAQLKTLKKQAAPIEEIMSQTRAQEIQKINVIRSQVQDRADTYLGGGYVVAKHLIEIIKGDLITFGSLIAGLIFVLLAVTFRRFRWVLFPLVACGSSVLVSMGLFGFVGLQTTVISANFIALQLILTLALMLHLITCFREVVRDKNSSGDSRSSSASEQGDNVVSMLKEKLSPCFNAAITTSVGFAALIFSGIQPVIDFGIMMLLAMTISMIVSLVLFPAMLACLKASSEPQEYRFFTYFLDKIRRFSITRPLIASISILAMTVGLGFGIPKLNVENSFINYFDKSTQVYQELHFIDQEFGGSTALDIIITLDKSKQKSDLLISAESINQLQLAQAAITAFKATGNVTSLVNFTELGKQINDNKPLTEYELDAIVELIDKQVANKLIGGYIDSDTSQVKISTRIKDSTPNLNRSEFLDNLRSDLAVVGLTTSSYQLTNLFILYQDILSRLFESQILTLGIVYLALGIVLLLVFRNVKIALIALIPNIIVTVMLLGLIGWMGIPLDLMTITIAAIAMGIAVDDTIHFISASTAKPDDTEFKYAFSHTGLAIVITSFIIAAGFSMFSLSNFLPSVHFGLLTAFAMIAAMIVDIVLLPVLLKRVLK